MPGVQGAVYKKSDRYQDKLVTRRKIAVNFEFAFSVPPGPTDCSATPPSSIAPTRTARVRENCQRRSGARSLRTLLALFQKHEQCAFTDVQPRPISGAARPRVSMP